MPRQKRSDSDDSFEFLKPIEYPITSELEASLSTFSSLNTYFPVLDCAGEVDSDLAGYWLPSKYRISKITDISQTTFYASADIERNELTAGIDISNVPVFIKRTHLLEPLKYMRGDYRVQRHDAMLPSPQCTYVQTVQKVNFPMNEAYIEAFGSFLTSQLVESGKCPHFPLFYGTFNGRVQKYAYNITDEFFSLKREKWFSNHFAKYFSIQIEGITAEKLAEYIFNSSVDSNSDDSDASDSEDATEDDATEDDATEDDATEDDATEDDATEDDATEDDATEDDATDSDETDNDEDDAANDDDEIKDLVDNVVLDTDQTTDGMETVEDLIITETEVMHLNPRKIDDDDITEEIYSVLDNYPVQLTVIERLVHTMDTLTTTQRPDEEWLAYLMQIMFALAVMQKEYDMIQNDLHTNNIMYSETTEEFLYYNVNGQHFKVPTYGKIMKILDFGRATFRYCGRLYVSDAFAEDGDAEGQLNCEPFYNKKRKRMNPNPSFDLCRLATTLIDSLYPAVPATPTPLFQVLNAWTTDKFGKNIYRKLTGEERYDGFKLYIEINKRMTNCIPLKQFSRPEFEIFKTTEVGALVYTL